MRQFAKITICVASALAFYNFAQAGDSIPAASPYSMIAARNAFGLQSPVVPPVIPPAIEPPPKIQITGSMTIFGREQVLFKVRALPRASGTRALESSYVLAEGEQQDDIKVVNIDEKNGAVTFNNHGAVQQISFSLASHLQTE